MTIKQDRPSWVRQSVVRVRRRTHRKWWETLRRGVSDHHDGRAGRTVVGMTIRRRSLRKFCETLRNRVSDNQNGCAGRTIMKTTVRHRRRWDRVLGLLTRTLWRSVVCATVRHRGLVLISSDRAGCTLSISDEPTWSCGVVDRYVSIPTT